MSIKNEIFKKLNITYKKTGRVLSVEEIRESKLSENNKYISKLIRDFKKSNNISNIIKEPKNEYVDDEKSFEKVSSEYNKNSSYINVNSLTINTLEKALEVAEVDMSIWEVERYLINSWQVTMKNINGKAISKTNYQTKVWLKKIVSEEDDTIHIIKSLIETIPSIKVNHNISNQFKKSTGLAGEIALYDAHFGKFAWDQETRMGNWDTEICRNAYLEGCRKNLEHLSMYPLEKIFFILGNDYMHFENTAALTPNGGHHLDVDTRLPKVIRIAQESVIEAINMCRSLAPVEVIWIAGNHDPHASLWLSYILEAYYRNDKLVNIDNSAPQMKARLWGKLLVGWVHDISGRRLNAGINSMPQWFPKLWGKSVYRELHTGHKHKKLSIKTNPIDTLGGTIIRQIPSLSSIDFWHLDNLYVDAVPAGEALLWSKDDGIVSHYTANIKPVK